ncbi:cyclopropane-fatty-acyl-phospholipid synthase family protein [Methylobacillus gramineus]|uniref:SAM-dependent methyltransferase n=1 Tax=Methylobacillus gramineus TaxID=755169 RepID=UPI001CFF634C|nr:cyclopropane-fatty-acyl-phospholipid synthase family protein [Methylobacillus gramineus]MCB5185858.1 cyclopropane-fatty-acyl-phospholipid synthase family protein [Methylobacillus gramineus]
MMSHNHPTMTFNNSVKRPLAARVLLAMLNNIDAGSLTLTTPDGHVITFGNTSTEASAQLHIHDWRAASLLIRQGDIGFAESLRKNWISSPDLLQLFTLALRNQQHLDRTVNGKWWSLILRRLSHCLLRNNSRHGSKRNIQAHYDLGNAFYQLWLDDTMTYSAAWFSGKTDMTLAEAQLAKYDRIIDELKATPGQRILEIGCGWGGFAERAAQRGFEVFGITLSPAQLQYATERIEKAGLDHLVTLALQDYRDVTGKFDHIVSIEMLEAVGKNHWHSYFSRLPLRLKDGGKIVIQSIDIQDSSFDSYQYGTDFIQQFIFPGGMLPCPNAIRSHAQQASLRLDNVQSFGLDYAKTLQLWYDRFMYRLDSVRAQGFDDSFIRLWQMYLKYCEAGFRERKTDVKLWTLSA